MRIHKHYGALMAWHHQTYTVTGTRTQCQQALRQAQVQNLLAGWWSPVSLLVMNWIALASNAIESARLRRTPTGYRPYPMPQPPATASYPYPYPQR